jgi:hypothetical protein
MGLQLFKSLVSTNSTTPAIGLVAVSYRMSQKGARGFERSNIESRQCDIVGG